MEYVYRNGSKKGTNRPLGPEHTACVHRHTRSRMHCDVWNSIRHGRLRCVDVCVTGLIRTARVIIRTTDVAQSRRYGLAFIEKAVNQCLNCHHGTPSQIDAGGFILSRKPISAEPGKSASVTWSQDI